MAKKKDDPRLDIVRTNLRMAVALRNTNYSETARRADLSRNALSQFLDRRTRLSYPNMLAICDVLDVPIGLLHRQDAITETKIRLYHTLERIPDHLASRALQEALDFAGDQS